VPSGRQPPGAREVIITLALVGGCVLAPGILYWSTIHGDPIRCIYGDPVCSLTVSTYLLAALTALVFGATLLAVYYAAKTLEHERSPALSIQRCVGDGDQHNYEVHTFYLDDVNDGFQQNRPSIFDRRDWGSYAFDCTSVGRAPLIGGELRLSMYINDDLSNIIVPIGSLKSGADRHIHLWFSRKFQTSRINVAGFRTMVGRATWYHVGPMRVLPAYSYSSPKFVELMDRLREQEQAVSEVPLEQATVAVSPPTTNFENHPEPAPPPTKPQLKVEHDVVTGDDGSAPAKTDVAGSPGSTNIEDHPEPAPPPTRPQLEVENDVITNDDGSTPDKTDGTGSSTTNNLEDRSEPAPPPTKPQLKVEHDVITNGDGSTQGKTETP
jgi:hypothetical protein